MTTYESISLVISIGAIVLSLYSHRRIGAVSKGTVEHHINERIGNTKEKVNEISLHMAPLLAIAEKTDEEEAQLKIVSNIFQSAIENNINAYEEACAKYLDRKVDRKRFKAILSGFCLSCKN